MSVCFVLLGGGIPWTKNPEVFTSTGESATLSLSLYVSVSVSVSVSLSLSLFVFVAVCVYIYIEFWWLSGGVDPCLGGGGACSLSSSLHVPVVVDTFSEPLFLSLLASVVVCVLVWVILLAFDL